MTPTQSHSLASQATAELPKPASYWHHQDATGTQVAEPSPIFTADQMHAHYLAGYEAGRASRAQSDPYAAATVWRKNLKGGM